MPLFVDVCRLLKIEESEILRTIEVSDVTKHQIVSLFKELRHETAVHSDRVLLVNEHTEVIHRNQSLHNKNSSRKI